MNSVPFLLLFTRCPNRRRSDFVITFPLCHCCLYSQSSSFSLFPSPPFKTENGESRSNDSWFKFNDEIEVCLSHIFCCFVDHMELFTIWVHVYVAIMLL